METHSQCVSKGLPAERRETREIATEYLYIKAAGNKPANKGQLPGQLPQEKKRKTPASRWAETEIGRNLAEKTIRRVGRTPNCGGSHEHSEPGVAWLTGGGKSKKEGAQSLRRGDSGFDEKKRKPPASLFGPSNYHQNEKQGSR